MNEKGIELIKQFEGFKAKPYLCPAGIPTIGYGTTIYPDGRNVTLKDQPITESQADIYLRYHVKFVNDKILKLTNGKLNENQLSALVSFAYNIGIEKLRKSTLFKRVLADKDGLSIREEFLKWKYAKDPKTGQMVVLPGLLRRRIAEANLYFSPL